MNVILSIAKTTVGEAIRRRVLLIILLIGVLFLAVAPGLSVLSLRQDFSVLASFTLGVIKLTSAIIAIVLTVYLIPNEIERRTIYTILSKPVLRWQFVIGKYLGAVAALGLMMALMTVTLVAVFAIMGKGASMDVILNLTRAPVMFFIQMSLLAAVAVFLSTFVPPITNFFLSGGVFMIGTIFSPVFDSIAQNEKTSQMVKLGAGVIHAIVPNFGMFNIENSVINQGQQIQNPTFFMLKMLLYALLYICACLFLGVIVFDRKEV